jgi:putative hemolysin
MKTRTFGLVALLAISSLTLAGCNKAETPVEENNAEIANPASVYCEDNGGTLNLEEGLCMFDDGSFCEEWSYYRGECQPGDIIYNTIDENVAEDVEANAYEIDYGTSDIYTQEDMEAAVAAIMNAFENEWEVKCEMHKLAYAGDERSQQELPNVQLRSEAPYAQALVMLSDFHTPANPEEAMAFEPDYEYTDYNWILGRTEGGEWTVIDWGY